jgi:phosphoribosylformylglycinamidine cyclo-ligase
MVVIVSKDQAKEAVDLLKAEGEQVFEIGFIRKQQAGEAPTIVV